MFPVHISLSSRTINGDYAYDSSRRFIGNTLNEWIMVQLMINGAGLLRLFWISIGYVF